MASIGQSEVERRRQWQSYIDEQLRDVGVRAQEPTTDQSTAQYLRAVARNLKYGHLAPSHPLYQVPFDKNLPNDVLYRLAPQLLAAVKDARNDASTVPPGEFREIVTVDPRTGYKQHRFVGQESFVKQMTTPGRRVKSFSKPIETIANYDRSAERAREVTGFVVR